MGRHVWGARIMLDSEFWFPACLTVPLTEINTTSLRPLISCAPIQSPLEQFVSTRMKMQRLNSWGARNPKRDWSLSFLIPSYCELAMKQRASMGVRIYPYLIASRGDWVT